MSVPTGTVTEAEPTMVGCSKGRHWPLEQALVTPSALQSVPSATGFTTQRPPEHTADVTHADGAAQVAPSSQVASTRHTPSWQVPGAPSRVHAAPSGKGAAARHAPSTHWPSPWHASTVHGEWSDEHACATPTHSPPSQRSKCEFGLPSEQNVPSGRGVPPPHTPLLHDGEERHCWAPLVAQSTPAHALNTVALPAGKGAM